MILIDYSQFSIASIFAFEKDLQKGKSNPEAVNIIRHAILSGIKMYKKTYGPKYGQIVFACDGQNYWRKEHFPHYKASRKTARASSNLDWKLIFDTMATIREEITNNFPYIVLHTDRAEADDVIASMCKYTQTNMMTDYGMFEDKQPVLIVSSDGDFKQLQKYDNVDQWSPIQKKWVKSASTRQELIEKICRGDSGDGIPNIMSSDDVFVTEGARQTKFYKTRLEQFYQGERDACDNDTERRNWDRNDMLINLDNVPDEIYTEIVQQFEKQMQSPMPDKMHIYNYLVKHRCRMLLNDLEDF